MKGAWITQTDPAGASARLPASPIDWLIPCPSEGIPPTPSKALAPIPRASIQAWWRQAIEFALDAGADFLLLDPAGLQMADLERIPAAAKPILWCSGGASSLSQSRRRSVERQFSGRRPRHLLAESHSGIAAICVSADVVRKLPFWANRETDFLGQFLIQLLLTETDLDPIPFAVPGAKLHRWQLALDRLAVHRMQLFYDTRFDIGAGSTDYDLKEGFDSSHHKALSYIRPGMRVLDLGCGPGYVAARALERGAAHITGLDQGPAGSSHPAQFRHISHDLNAPSLPVDPSDYDVVFLLDIIEHLHEPERFLRLLRESASGNQPPVLLTTANIGFIVQRLMLLAGKFNYGKKGILDRTHTRLFTFESLKRALEENGFEIIETAGIPAPFPKAIGHTWFSRLLLFINQLFIRLLPGLFSYQIYLLCRGLPRWQRLPGQKRWTPAPDL